MSGICFYEVGGCIRDEFMGLKSKDVDFTVVAPSFDAMRSELVDRGFTIWEERPEFGTIRAGVPKDDILRARTKDADFVLARKDGPSSDGRRPDFVEPGDLIDDLARRDFTVNSIARSVQGEIIDPFGGRADIEDRILRFVGDPEERIREDGLRVIRGFRFMVMKGLTPTPFTARALVSHIAIDMLAGVAIERVQQELDRMFKFDTIATMEVLAHGMPPEMVDVIFRDGLRLGATLAQ